MPLSQSAQDELRAELANIETYRKQLNDRLDERAMAIRAILEPFAVLPPVAQPVTLLPSSDSLKAAATVIESLRERLDKATKPPVLPLSGPTKFANTGLRASIVEVLRAKGPLRAPAVAKVLEASGFANDSKTPLATRVYNDLWRMKEAGLVENHDGEFSLKEVA